MPHGDRANPTIERFPARVRTDLRDVPMLAAGGASTIDLSNTQAAMDIIRGHAADPSVFDKRVPFIWAAQISNSRPDYYATRMDPNTTLRNFVEDAINGVAFLDSHNSNQQPFGRSFAAKQIDGADGQSEVYAAFYTIPDLNTNGISSNDYIDSIRSGITKDVSIGFKRGDGFKMVCSLCGGNMLRYDECPHFEGVTYDVPDDNGDVQQRTAMAWIVNARLSECSGVYDGATPSAMVEKATFLAERGLLKPQVRTALEQQLRVTLPSKNTTYLLPTQERASLNDPAAPPVTADKPETTRATDAAASTTTKGDRAMEREHIDALQVSLRSAGIIKDDATLTSFEDGQRRLEAETARLRSVETQSNEYRTAEVTDALAEGVRAYGADKFDTERYTTLFATASLKDIRSFRTEWQAAADAVLATTRQSDETADEEAAGDAATGDTATRGAVVKDINDKRNVAPMLPESVYSQR